MLSFVGFNSDICTPGWGLRVTSSAWTTKLKLREVMGHTRGGPAGRGRTQVPGWALGPQPARVSLAWSHLQLWPEGAEVSASDREPAPSICPRCRVNPGTHKSQPEHQQVQEGVRSTVQRH